MEIGCYRLGRRTRSKLYHIARSDPRFSWCLPKKTRPTKMWDSPTALRRSHARFFDEGDQERLRLLGARPVQSRAGLLLRFIRCGDLARLPARLGKTRMPRLLELFLGTGLVDRTFGELGWEVISLDLDPSAEPTICADVCSWESMSMFAPGYFDMIWTSPPCTEYSRALTRRLRKQEGDRTAIRTLEVIRDLHVLA